MLLLLVKYYCTHFILKINLCLLRSKSGEMSHYKGMEFETFFCCCFQKRLFPPLKTHSLIQTSYPFHWIFRYLFRKKNQTWSWLHQSSLIKSVFSEIRVRTWVQVVSRQKNIPLIGRPRPDMSANQIPFLAGNHLNSCPESDLRKNWL